MTPSEGAQSLVQQILVSLQKPTDVDLATMVALRPCSARNSANVVGFVFGDEKPGAHGLDASNTSHDVMEYERRQVDMATTSDLAVENPVRSGRERSQEILGESSRSQPSGER